MCKSKTFLQTHSKKKKNGNIKTLHIIFKNIKDNIKSIKHGCIILKWPQAEK